MSATLLSLAYNAANTANTYQKARNDGKLLSSKSWIDFTSVTDIEPIVLIGSDIRHEKIMTSVMQAMLKTYMSYYLRAADMLSNLESVEILKRLDVLNPNRKISDSIYSAAEPVYNAIQGAAGDVAGSFESAYDSAESEDQPYLDFEYFVPEKTTEASLESDDLRNSKNADLVAGATATVNFKENKSEFPVTVSFRLLPYIEDNSVITQTFAVGSNRNSKQERKHRRKSGELSFSDYWFMRDIIKQHRNTMIKSKTNFYKDTLARRSKQQATNMMQGGKTTAEISGGVVISKRTAVAIEREIEGSLNDFAIRENALDKISAMILIVVDPDNEEIFIYRYSVREVIRLDFANVKDYNTRGPDMLELVKSLNVARR